MYVRRWVTFEWNYQVEQTQKWKKIVQVPKRFRKIKILWFLKLYSNIRIFLECTLIIALILIFWTVFCGADTKIKKNHASAKET